MSVCITMGRSDEPRCGVYSASKYPFVCIEVGDISFHFDGIDPADAVAARRLARAFDEAADAMDQLRTKRSEVETAGPR